VAPALDLGSGFALFAINNTYLTAPFFSFKPESLKEHKYDLSGDLNEQTREAIKRGDNKGVKKLLEVF
jgi:hypothetical protein